MDEVDLAIQQALQQQDAIKAEIAALQANSASSPAAQFGFDVGAGLARAGAGLVDVLGAPLTFAARQLGADPETTRYFPLTKELEPVSRDIAASLGVQPDTTTQEVVSFLAPSPLSKATALRQAVSGAAAYGGMKAGEAIAPESPYAGLIGALSPGLLSAAASRGAAKLAPGMVEKGKALQRNIFGLRQSDYKSSQQAMLEVSPKKFESQAKKSADNLIQEEVLPKTTDADVLYDAAISKKIELDDQIEKVLQKVDASNIKVKMPDFPRASKYIESDKVDLTLAPAYRQIISKFKKVVRNESKFVEPEIPTLYDELGRPIPKEQSSTYRKALEAYVEEQKGQSKLSLDVLNKQRKVYGEKYKQGPQSDPGFWRAFYRDLKTHIEKYAPEVKELNRKKQDLIVVEPALERAKSEKVRKLGDLTPSKLAYTTGTLGVPGFSYMFGGPAVGVPVALLAAALGTRPGRAATGRTLQALGETSIQPSQLDLARALQSAGAAVDVPREQVTEENQVQQALALQEQIKAEIAALQAQEATPQAVTTPTATATPEATETIEPTPTITVEGADYSIPTGDRYASPNLVKAVIAVESSGKRGQVSSKGARGLMQIMPATAKELGIDPTDPEQNIEGGSSYLQTLINKFNDVELALAAYNWGQGNIANALKKLRGENRKPTWDNIKRYNPRLPSETRKYVGKVLSNMRA